MAESTITFKTTVNTAGLYYLLDDADPIDNVYSFVDQDGRKVKMVNNKGPYVAREGGILPGSNMLTRLQAIFNTSAIKEIIFEYGDITITGNLDCNGKKVTFKNGSKIIGTNVLDNGILNCDIWSQCFTTSTTLTNFSSVRMEVSTENFGSKGDGVTEDSVALQKTSDSVIKNLKMPKNIRLFCGKRYNTYGWVLHNWNGTKYDQFSINIIGEKSAFSANPTQLPQLFGTNVNSFTLNVQRATGFHIQGVCFGGNLVLPGVSTQAEWVAYYKKPYATFLSDAIVTARDSRYSANTHLLIDGFRNTNSLPPDGGFPDWNGTVTVQNPSGINWYRGLFPEAPAGSTGGVMEDLSFDGATLSVALSINGESQQCENMSFKNIYANNCKAVFAFCQRESKGCNIYGGYSIDRVHTVIDGINYGAGPGTLPDIEKYNFSGSVIQFVQGNVQFPVTFKSIYSEQCFRIGDLYTTGGMSTWDNCKLTFNTTTSPLLIPQTHFSGSNSNFKGGQVLYYDDNFNKRLIIQGEKIFFSDLVQLELPPIGTSGIDYPGSQRMVTVDIERCLYGSGTASLAGWPTLKGLIVSRNDGAIAHGNITVENQNEKNYGRVLEKFECGGYDMVDTFISAVNFTVSDVARTATINTGYVPNGRYIFIYIAGKYVVLGRVTGWSGSLLTVSDVPLNIPGGAGSSVYYGVSDYKRFKGRFTGVWTTESPNITNVFGDPTVLEKDDFSTYYILSYNAGTGVAVLSGNSAFTSAGEIYSGATPLGTETITYTRKAPPTAVYYNTETIKFFPGDIWVSAPIEGASTSSITKFRCTTSGYLFASNIGETKQSVWEEIFDSEFKQNITSTTDFAVVMPAGRFIKGWIAKSTAGITLVTGTTNGGTDVDPGTPLTANVSEPIGYAKKYDSDTTLYFTGITGNGATVTVNFY